MLSEQSMEAAVKQKTAEKRSLKPSAPTGAMSRKPAVGPAMKIPLLDLTRKFHSIEAELRQRWDEIFSTMRLLNGANLLAFEYEFAEFCGVKHALGVACGTDAISLSLRALNVAPGDEVILAAHAPAPVIEPIIHMGGVPVLIDKAEADYGPDLDGLWAAISTKTKAVIAVHFLGLPCAMDEINRIAAERGIAVVEDASQAQGAFYRGKRAAGLGSITPMSLGPVKNLACYGDGGVVLVNDDALAASVRLQRVHGQAEKYDHKLYGWNSRLDELQAAVLRLKLPSLDYDNRRRRGIADAYNLRFRDLPVTLPPRFAERQSVYHQYVIETSDRDPLKRFLEMHGVGTGIYYPLPLHQHEAWRMRGLPAYRLPESERYGRENLALPIFAEMTDDEVSYVADRVTQYFANRV
jgi:dTDP-4-amino-4,6-dideoxygalactose transaminase